MDEYHEMHLVFHVLENCAENPNQNQALNLFQRKLELFSRENLFPMEESDEYEYEASISWVDKYYRDLIHSSTHTSILASSSGDENWENEFSLLVQQEELEDFL